MDPHCLGCDCSNQEENPVSHEIVSNEIYLGYMCLACSSEKRWCHLHQKCHDKREFFGNKCVYQLGFYQELKGKYDALISQLKSSQIIPQNF